MVRINYAVGIGLYMIPSNLVLQVGVIQKYNNNLVIADDSTEIGGNKDINPVDTAAAVNRLDSAEALNPVDSAAKQNSTGISPAERGTGIAFVVLFSIFNTLFPVISTAKSRKSIIRCLEKNSTSSPAFLKRKLISPPNIPGKETIAFLAKPRSQLAIFINCRLTLSVKVFSSGGSGVAVGVGCTARKKGKR